MWTLALAALSLAQIPRLAVEQYTLPNGLVVVLQPDPQEKLVALSLRYPVGSRHDPANQAGLAHLVEHLMFLDQTHGAPFSQQLEALGGVDINAYTTFDHTEYRALFPPEVLPLALWLEARRMESLGDGASESVLASERKVVENEALQRTNDAAFGVGEQILFESIFPHPHPLHYLPIGDQDQLESVTPADVTLFHSRHYGPKDASLVIAGNFNLEATKRWIEDYFSAIAPRERPRFYALARADLRAKPIFGPEWVSGHARISLLWAGPASDHAFIPSLEVFAAMLNYASFSRGGLANYAQDSIDGMAAGLVETPAGNLFRVDAWVVPGMLPMLARGRVMSIFETYFWVKPQKEELAGTQQRLQVDFTRALARLPTRAALLQSARAKEGHAQKLWDLPRRWKNVTADGIMKALVTVMANEPQTLIVQPVRR